MFEKILVAVDGSGHAGKAVDIAIELAKRFDSRLIVLSVYRHQSGYESSHALVRTSKVPDRPDTSLKEIATDAVAWAVERANEAGVGKVSKRVRRGPPARTIVKEAKNEGVDAIILGSRGLGDIGGLLLGSVSHKVTSLAECTCITVK